MRTFLSACLLLCAFPAPAPAASARQAVLVLYRDSAVGPKPDRTGLLRERRRQTAEFERAVLGPTASAHENRVTLWIANATRVSLTADERRRVERHPLVARVESARSRRWIAPSAGGPEEALREPFTYGLVQLRVPELRARRPDLDGRGVRVGIIDTGIDPQHPDLRDRLLAFRDFTPARRAAAYDDHGHGSHVAGTIAGGSNSRTAIGVAPGVQLIVAKGFDGRGRAEDADLLLAMQWLADPDGDPATNDAPQVVSNSWDNSEKYGEKDPEDIAFCRAVNAWAELGILPVFAAGNEGPDRRTVQIPGACPKSLTVGASTQEDDVWGMELAGPAQWKSGKAQKPEIVAPGADVWSAAPGGSYRTRSGTSMATPHAAGLAALMLQIDPRLSIERLREGMQATAKSLARMGYDPDFGSGRIDAEAAARWVERGAGR